MTNFEKIKAKSIEDMALWIMCPYDTAGEPEDIMPCIKDGSEEPANIGRCYECCLEWLKREAKETEKNEDRCVSCGCTIPEGRMVCPSCESEAKEKKMYGFHEGYSENSNIKYCPYCGEEIYIRCGDGTAECQNCGAAVAVIYKELPEGIEDGEE